MKAALSVLQIDACEGLVLKLCAGIFLQSPARFVALKRAETLGSRKCTFKVDSLSCLFPQIGLHMNLVLCYVIGLLLCACVELVKPHL